MTPEDARQLIGLERGFSADELESAFRRRSRELESKIERAPTPGLKEKYRRSLGQMEEAWEILSGAAANFPSLHPTAGREKSSAMSAAKATGDIKPVSEPPPWSAHPRVQSSYRFPLIGGLVILAAILVGVGYQRSEHFAHARGGLMVKTAPAGATIALGGEDTQSSPATFKSERLGTYPVHITLDGYEPFDETAEIKENQFTDLGTITLQRSKGSIQITTDPSGLDYRVSQNGGVINSGKTPATIPSLLTGDYDVSVTKGDWEIKNIIKVRRNENITYSPQFVTGSVLIESDPPGAGVFQGERSLGKTPLTLKDVRAGERDYILRRAGYKTTTVQTTVAGNEQASINTTLKKSEFPTGTWAGDITGTAFTNHLVVVIDDSGAVTVTFKHHDYLLPGNSYVGDDEDAGLSSFSWTVRLRGKVVVTSATSLNLVLDKDFDVLGKDPDSLSDAFVRRRCDLGGSTSQCTLQGEDLLLGGTNVLTKQ